MTLLEVEREVGASAMHSELLPRASDCQFDDPLDVGMLDRVLRAFRDVSSRLGAVMDATILADYLDAAADDPVAVEAYLDLGYWDRVRVLEAVKHDLLGL